MDWSDKDAIRHRFVEVQNATAEDVAKKVDKILVGISIDIDAGLNALKEEIYNVPKPRDGKLKHVVTIVGYRMTTEDGGYGMMIITDTCDLFYIDEVIDDKKKKKENALKLNCLENFET
ncbi:hypothetical protein CARUB_v10015999mg [Capsella rubella]|uniref:Uncharacterized protein n=1 Tax=Capsella rubella TaxID=81985 RepID=R0GAU8_9BRAS|nr:hypothetical protein CARUB_v10015999mg [Capsella rubella]